jgi:hypothetical protein
MSGSTIFMAFSWLFGATWWKSMSRYFWCFSWRCMCMIVRRWHVNLIKFVKYSDTNNIWSYYDIYHERNIYIIICMVQMKSNEYDLSLAIIWSSDLVSGNLLSFQNCLCGHLEHIRQGRDENKRLKSCVGPGFMFKPTDWNRYTHIKIIKCPNVRYIWRCFPITRATEAWGSHRTCLILRFSSVAACHRHLPRKGYPHVLRAAPREMLKIHKIQFGEPRVALQSHQLPAQFPYTPSE